MANRISEKTRQDPQLLHRAVSSMPETQQQRIDRLLSDIRQLPDCCASIANSLDELTVNKQTLELPDYINELLGEAVGAMITLRELVKALEADSSK
jgi:hypothetical protein